MSRNREIELKLDVEDGCASALAGMPLLARGPDKVADQLSIYYDTPDGTLREGGFTLRVRQSGSRFVQTVKQSAGMSAGLFDRPEWECDIGGPDPDLDAAAETPLGELLGKKIRKKLKPLIRVEVRRSRWDLERDGSSIELILDEGEVIGGEARQKIAEIELELKEGEAPRLFDLALELGRAAPVRLGVLTKAERGYRLADGSADKALKAEPIQLGSDMSAADGFAAIAYACLRQFRLNEALVVERGDSVALHQARVAMRRLRSAFTLFRPVIADARYEGLREEIRWFTDQLGDARNLDVLLKRFTPNPRKDPAGDALVARLKSERAIAYAQVVEALGSDRLRALMLELAAWIETGAWRMENGMARLPVRDFAGLQLDKRWRKVKKGGRALSDLDPEPRHRLRIEVKKLRYAVEFLASLHKGPEAAARQKRFGQALEDMQEQLGELNDLETARILLQNLLQDGADSAEMFRYAGEQLEAPESEDKQLEAAQKAHAELMEVGRFWR